MKVAIPLDEDKISVCPSFGRAPFFFFQDSEKGTGEIRENPAAESQGGAGTKAAQFLLDERTEALITVRCGQNAADVLVAAGIKVYKTAAPTVAENLRDFAEGKLSVMTQFHAGFHGRQ